MSITIKGSSLEDLQISIKQMLLEDEFAVLWERNPSELPRNNSSLWRLLVELINFFGFPKQENELKKKNKVPQFVFL